MKRKNIISYDKKINESNFYRDKKLFKTDDINVNKYWFLKKNHMVKKSSFRYFIG